MLQRLHRDVDAHILANGFQFPLDGRGVIPRVAQTQRIQHRHMQRRRDASVIHHEHAPSVGRIRRQRHCRLTRAGQTGADRDVQHLVVIGQQLIPEGGHIRRGRLGSSNFRAAPLMRIKLRAGDRLLLQIANAVDGKRHRQHRDTEGLRHFRGDAGVAVSCDSNVFHHYCASVYDNQHILAQMRVRLQAIAVSNFVDNSKRYRRFRLCGGDKGAFRSPP